MFEAELYQMCKEFLNLADNLLWSGRIDKQTHRHITGLKKQFVADYESQLYRDKTSKVTNQTKFSLLN